MKQIHVSQCIRLFVVPERLSIATGIEALSFASAYSCSLEVKLYVISMYIKALQDNVCRLNTNE